MQCFCNFLTIFRVCTVLYDNSSCIIGSVSYIDPPGGADRHGRSHSGPVLCVWGGAGSFCHCVSEIS